MCLLLCGECGSRFVATNQRQYQCASRTYGGLSACSNQIRVPRENAEQAIVNYLAEELLSSEAIEIAKREYREAVLEKLGSRERENVGNPDALCAEEAKLREMLKAGTLSADIAQAALDALANKRRRAASTARISPVTALASFALRRERYTATVRNLGSHVARSEHSTEARELVRELLGGHGTVFRRCGRVGARFESAGLPFSAAFAYKSMRYNIGRGERLATC